MIILRSRLEYKRNQSTLKHIVKASFQTSRLVCYRSGKNVHLPQANSAFQPSGCGVCWAADRILVRPPVLKLVAQPVAKDQRCEEQLP
jgi:cytochrome c551/c552